MRVERNIPPGWLAEVNGELVPVTHVFHDEYNPVDDTFVAGPLADGRWFTGYATYHRITRAH